MARVHALLIIDVQNDFCQGGSLEVPDANAIIPVINKMRAEHTWGLVVLSRDFHPADHMSFASNNDGAEVFSVKELEDGPQTMWPDHCVQGTAGSEFHAELARADGDKVVCKGTDRTVDSYSAFFDNAKKNQTELDGLLREHGVTDVYVVGLAEDFCCGFTALDAAALGYTVHFVRDAMRGIAQDSKDAMHAKLSAAGVHTTTSSELSLQ